jgi:hypothetical protein
MESTVIVTFAPKGQLDPGHRNFKIINQEVQVNLSSIQLNGDGLYNTKFEVIPIESQDGDRLPRMIDYRDMEIGANAQKLITRTFEKARSKSTKTTNGGGREGKTMRGGHYARH